MTAQAHRAKLPSCITSYAVQLLVERASSRAHRDLLQARPDLGDVHNGSQCDVDALVPNSK